MKYNWWVARKTFKVHKAIAPYSVVTREIQLVQNYVSLCRRQSEIIFVSAPGNLPEIIRKLFHRLIAARVYFPTCPLSLK